jgi:hypothetical protein
VLQRRIAAKPARVFRSNLGERFIGIGGNQTLLDFPKVGQSLKAAYPFIVLKRQAKSH